MFKGFHLSLRQIFAAGLLLRFLLMPFFLSIDLVIISQMARHLGHEGVWNIYRYLYYQEGSPAWTYPFLVYLVLGGAIWLFKPLMPKFATMLASWSVDEISKTSWITTPHVYRYLFLLKIPFLVFDLLTAFVLVKIFKTESEKKRALVLWMFSPFVLYASFIFGQVDILQVFFMTLSLYFFAKQRKGLAFVSLGFAVAMKQFPLLLLLPTLIIVAKSFRDLIRFTFFGLLPYLVFYLPFARDEIYRLVVLGSSQSQYFFLPTIKLGWEDSVSFFWIGFGLVLTWLLINRHRFEVKNSFEESRREAICFEMIWKSWFFVLALFYAFSLFHPQWFLWGVPVLVLFFVKEIKSNWLFLLLVACFFVYLFNWQTTTSWSMVTPLNPNLFYGLLPPSKAVDAFYPSDIVIRIFRSILSGTLLGIAVYLFQRISFKYEDKV